MKAVRRFQARFQPSVHMARNTSSKLSANRFITEITNIRPAMFRLFHVRGGPYCLLWCRSQQRARHLDV